MRKKGLYVGLASAAVAICIALAWGHYLWRRQSELSNCFQGDRMWLVFPPATAAPRDLSSVTFQGYCSPEEKSALAKFLGGQPLDEFPELVPLVIRVEFPHRPSAAEIELGHRGSTRPHISLNLIKDPDKGWRLTEVASVHYHYAPSLDR